MGFCAISKFDTSWANVEVFTHEEANSQGEVKKEGGLKMQKSWMGQRHGGNGSREVSYEEVYLKENGKI